MEIKMRVNFMDWKRGDVVDLPQDRAEQYLRLKVGEIPRKKTAKAPRNKMTTGARKK